MTLPPSIRAKPHVHGGDGIGEYAGVDRARGAASPGWLAHPGAADRALPFGQTAAIEGGLQQAGPQQRTKRAEAPYGNEQTMRPGQRWSDSGTRDAETRMPRDFPQRLLWLKERSGMTWEEMALAVGVDSRQLLRWRRGASPSGGAMLSLARLAARLPGGIPELLGQNPALISSEEVRD